jgi:hypothetical protein
MALKIVVGVLFAAAAACGPNPAGNVLVASPKSPPTADAPKGDDVVKFVPPDPDDLIVDDGTGDDEEEEEEEEEEKEE